MASLKKSDKKAALDFASWSFNVTTSVGIIMVNKALMATYGFSFGMSVLNRGVAFSSSVQSPSSRNSANEHFL
jgi:hypothetical protein